MVNYIFNSTTHSALWRRIVAMVCRSYTVECPSFLCCVDCRNCNTHSNLWGNVFRAQRKTVNDQFWVDSQLTFSGLVAATDGCSGAAILSDAKREVRLDWRRAKRRYRTVCVALCDDPAVYIQINANTQSKVQCRMLSKMRSSLLYKQWTEEILLTTNNNMRYCAAICNASMNW